MPGLRKSHVVDLVFLMSACVALLSSSAAIAQEKEAELSQPQARIIDQFGRAHGCDHGARLDNFAIELANAPDSTGYVIVYGPSGRGSGTVDHRLNLTKHYIVDTRGIDEARIKTISGGSYSDTRESFAELWIVPPGAEAPQPRKFENDAATFTGKYDEFQMAEVTDWGDSTGPSTGNSALAGFVEVLTVQPKMSAYVVAYNGAKSAPGAWRRAADRTVSSLKRSGVSEERLNVIFAGYGKQTKIQLWVLPRNAPPPAKDAGRERKPDTAMRIGSYPSYFLGDNEESRAVFKGFADVLKAEESLTACLIVRLEMPSEIEMSEWSASDPTEPELDLMQLVEKWKKDLKREYGIADQRLVVISVAPSSEPGPSSLETWIVPPGVSPPNPYVVEEEDDSEDEVDPEF